MSKSVKMSESGPRGVRRGAVALALSSAIAVALVAAPSASAGGAATADPCAVLARGGSCTISDTDGQFVPVHIPVGVQTITAIVSGAGGRRSAAPMRGAWETVGTFSPDVVGHDLLVDVGRMSDNGEMGGDSVIVNGGLASSRVVVDSGGGFAAGNGYSDRSFDRMASFPTQPGTGSITLIAQSATDLVNQGNSAERSMPIPSNAHKFEVIMAGGAGSRLHNGSNMEGYGAVVSGVLDTGTATSWNYFVGTSAYNGGFGFGRPGLGGRGYGDGKNGGDGGGASMLMDATSAHASGIPVLAAGGGGGAGGDNCSWAFGCHAGGRGGSAGGDGVRYPRNGTAGSGGYRGGLAGNPGAVGGINPNGSAGVNGLPSPDAFSPGDAAGGGGGGAGYPQGGQGGDGTDDTPDADGAGGGGSGASYTAPGSVTGVQQSTTATCADGFIILVPLV